MAVWIAHPYSGEGTFFADQVLELDPVEMKLLGPDGRPLQRKKNPMGFDLRPRSVEEKQT